VREQSGAAVDRALAAHRRQLDPDSRAMPVGIRLRELPLDQPAWFVILSEAVFQGREKGSDSAGRYKSLKTMMKK